MRKLLSIVGLMLGLTTLSVAAEKEIKVGITQIVEHPSLDAARKGVEKALKEKGKGKNIKIEYQSAQGDFGTAQLIAKSYVSSKKDVIVAISTPSAQASLNATKTIPIVYTAVTDGASTGLKGNNITGTSDMSPLDKQAELIKTLLPNAKKVGFLYNPSEQNSLLLLEKFKGIAKAKGLTVVEKGALATESIDYEKLGYQTGERVIDVLNGKNPKDIPVETLKQTTLVINQKIAKKYNISLDNLKLKNAIKY